MRIFEILTLGTLFLALVARFFPEAKRPSWVNYFPGAAGLFILIHLVIEGYRWQMVPAYSLAFLLFVLSVPRLLGKRVNSPVGRGRSILNGIGTALGLVVIAIAAALPALFPVFEMPNPTGPYAVGTTSFAFTDESRPEIFTPTPQINAWSMCRPGIQPDQPQILHAHPCGLIRKRLLPWWQKPPWNAGLCV